MRNRFIVVWICLFAVLLPSVVFAQDFSIHSDLLKPMQTASSHHKMLMVEFYGPWCSYCKKMDKVLANSSVKAAISKNYHHYRLDVGKGDKHTSCLATYGVTAVPVFLIFNMDGSVRERLDGARNPKEFTGFLRRNLGVARLPSRSCVRAEVRGVFQRGGTAAPSSPQSSPQAGIDPDLKDDLQKANAAGKILIVDFYAEWCGWCKRMDSTVGDPSIKSLLDQRFYYSRVDIGNFDKHTGCIQRYGITGIPKLLVFNRDGGLNSVCGGYRDANGFNTFLQSAIQGAH